MDIKVTLSNLRVAPRKARLVVDLVRNKNVQDARNLLHFTVNKTASPVLKLLNSAVASATHDLKLDETNLYISKITVDEGPKMKRSFPMSRGRAYPIMKRTSHIALTVSELKPSDKPKKEKEAEVVKANPRTKRAELSSNDGKAEPKETKTKKVTKPKKK